jgi:hypothetical protein
MRTLTLLFTLLIACTLALAPTADARDAYGSFTSPILDLDGEPTASDTLDYLTGTSDSLTVYVNLQDFHEIGDSIGISIWLESDTGNVAYDLAYDLKMFHDETESYTTIADDSTNESTVETYWIEFTGPAREIKLRLEGDTGNSSYTKVKMWAHGIRRVPDGKFHAWAYRGSTLVYSFPKMPD